ncbi:chymotrypsin inhibitor-like [Anomaloglossus baeobatrachus]|uniref:chymotrypsin inhibitor-like n=1 Tax=Anomaloglossus baeobatrachus TaxID=238106 RepID=UPI003F5049C1
MLKVSTLLLVSSLVLCSMARHRKHDCTTHEEYKSCGTACPETCDNYGTEANLICTMHCEPGCYCAKPYILKRKDDDECILPDYCPMKYYGY